MPPMIKDEPEDKEQPLASIPTKAENLPVRLEDIPLRVEHSHESAGSSSTGAPTFRMKGSASPERERAAQGASQNTGVGGFTEGLSDDSRQAYDRVMETWPDFLAEQEHRHAWRLFPMTWEENGQTKLIVHSSECSSDKTAESPLLSVDETPEAGPLLSHWYRSPNAKLQIIKPYEDSLITIVATNKSDAADQRRRNTAISIDFGRLPHLSDTGYLLPEYQALGNRLGNDFVLALTQATNTLFDVTSYTASGPHIAKDEEDK